MTVSDWIQVVAVLAALAASVVALVIATMDRKVQLQIALRDREQARLAIELEYAVRLSANRNMGGSTDPAEVKRLGAEAMALVGVVGERWVPRQWRYVMEDRTVEQLEADIDDESIEMPEWVQWRNEATVAVQSIVAAMNNERSAR